MALGRLTRQIWPLITPITAPKTRPPMDQDPNKEAEDLAVILRNLKCDVEINHVTYYYRINNTRCKGLYSFIAQARRALTKAGVILP